ncbi:hypothetical protein COCSADRAFT_103379 [Bipolaris sorokiniana ND90Pr]|uniref:Rhodopsin domain-containing protein n=1 Tax=Cochliobolus sativus (strain ND90Pr / ATCC 201652) TaxID=665912 RepID=M2RTV3_COCSN|nr:uncharacterized protein COCSADRAFT_103379 [Bipolaris sorokiniana ND90Pr]EMD58598.1 hypothetical protein COCSADRAFT_103379 [Bipolaris sorokiniana ND90Pr]
MSTQLQNWVSNPEETHGPLMSITVWSLCGVAGFFLALRLAIQKNQGKLWYDSLILTVSWLFLLCQAILNQLSVNLGFGKHSLDIDFSNFETITYLGATGLTVSTTAITLSKISFGVTLFRLTEGWVKAYVCFAMATLLIFAIPTCILPWVLCKPLTKTFVDIVPGTCMNKHPSVVYGRFQAIWSAIMDISLALIPWKIIWNLQMRPAEKIGVCIAMSLGVLAGVTAILRARYVELLTKLDLSYDATNTVIWSSAESSMAIVATSIPVLRVFFRQAVTSVINSYQNSSRERRFKSQASNLSGMNSTAHASKLGSKNIKIEATGSSSNKRRSNMFNSDGTTNVSQESLVDADGKRQEAYVEMDNLVVDEVTGRVTLASPASMNSLEGGLPHRPHTRL